MFHITWYITRLSPHRAMGRFPCGESPRFTVHGGTVRVTSSVDSEEATFPFKLISILIYNTINHCWNSSGSFNNYNCYVTNHTRSLHSGKTITLVEKIPPDAVKTSLSDAVLACIRWGRSSSLTNSDAVQNRIRNHNLMRFMGKTASDYGNNLMRYYIKTASELVNWRLKKCKPAAGLH